MTAPEALLRSVAASRRQLGELRQAVADLDDELDRLERAARDVLHEVADW